MFKGMVVNNQGGFMDIKVIFLDMDNTIAETKTPLSIEYYDGMYLEKRPIQIVIDAVNTLYPNTPIVIISKAQGGLKGIDEKIKWLDNIPLKIKDKIFLLENDKYYMKAVYIDQWCDKNNVNIEECLIIDDSKEVLRYCSAYCLQTKYPQQLICDYEERIKQLNEEVLDSVSSKIVKLEKSNKSS